MMEKSAIDLVQKFRESSELEFKKAENNLPSSFWETYSAFCNTQGGIVILGIEEKKDKNVIVGVKDPNKMIDDLWNMVSNKTKVSYSVLKNNDIHSYKIEDKIIIIVEIREAPDDKKPVFLHDNMREVYIRCGTGDKKATPEEIRAMVLNSSPQTQFLNNFTIEDLDPNSVREFKDEASKRFPAKKFNEMGVEEFLFEIGVLRKNREDKKYQLATEGLLFLGKYRSITEKFSRYYLDYFYRGLGNDRWIDRVSSDEFYDKEMNLYNFYNIVKNKIFLSLKEGFALDDNQERIKSITVIQESIREALANTILHADYFCDFPKVKIEMYDNWFCFENSGKMLISVEEYLQGGKSKIRNTILMQLARLIGMAERQGFGGVQIFKTAKSLDYRIPEITTGLQGTTLKIWNVDALQSHSELSLEERSVYEILLKSKENVTKAFIKKETNFNDYTVRKCLSSLIEKNLVIQIGAARATRYSIRVGMSEYLTKVQMLLKSLSDELVLK